MLSHVLFSRRDFPNLKTRGTNLTLQYMKGRQKVPTDDHFYRVTLYCTCSTFFVVTIASIVNLRWENKHLSIISTEAAARMAIRSNQLIRFDGLIANCQVLYFKDKPPEKRGFP